MGKINAIFGHGTVQILVSETLLFAFEARLFPPFPLFPSALLFQKDSLVSLEELPPKKTDVSRLVQSVLTFFLKNYPSLCKRRVGTEQTSNIPVAM